MGRLKWLYDRIYDRIYGTPTALFPAKSFLCWRVRKDPDAHTFLWANGRCFPWSSSNDRREQERNRAKSPSPSPVNNFTTGSIDGHNSSLGEAQACAVTFQSLLTGVLSEDVLATGMCSPKFVCCTSYAPLFLGHVGASATGPLSVTSEVGVQVGARVRSSKPRVLDASPETGSFQKFLPLQFGDVRSWRQRANKLSCFHRCATDLPSHLGLHSRGGGHPMIFSGTENRPAPVCSPHNHLLLST